MRSIGFSIKRSSKADFFRRNAHFSKDQLAHSIRDKLALKPNLIEKNNIKHNKVAIDYGKSFSCRNLFIASGYVST